MTNAKLTRRALLSSVLALVLCFTMLLGTTFAWFTDEAVSSGNKIIAGNLDVKLWLYDAHGNGTEITKDSAPIFGGENSLAATANPDSANTVWEPGKTQVAYLAIENAGNLDLKYQVALEAKNEVNNLCDVMQYTITPNATTANKVSGWDASAAKTVSVGTQIVSVNEAGGTDLVLKKGETHYFALSIHMDEKAGNEYKNGEVEFDITVLATQLNSEFDGLNSPDYDKDAPYSVSITKVTTVVNTNDTVGEETTISYSDEKSAISAVTVTVPVGAALEAGAEELVLTIKEADEVHSNVTVASTQAAKTYDIDIAGLADSNTEPVAISMTIEKGLSGVELYHEDTLIDSTYDADTGVLTFATTGFSPFTVVHKLNVKEIDILRDKLAAAKSGETVEFALTQDAIVTEQIRVPEGVTLVLDGNGHTMNMDLSVSGIYAYRADIEIQNLTVKGSAQTAIFTKGDRGIVDGKMVEYLVYPVLENVTVDMSKVDLSPVYFNGMGEATLNNCTFTGVGYARTNYVDGAHLYAGAEMKVEVNGGNVGVVFINANGQSPESVFASGITVNSGVVEKLILESDWLDNKTGSATYTNNGGTVNEVVKVVDTGAELVSAIQEGYSVALYKDVSYDGVIRPANGTSFTVYGYNNTINASIYTAGGGNIVLNDVTLSSAESYAFYNQGGNVTMNNVTVNKDGNWALLLYGGGKVEMNNCTVSGEATTASIWFGDGRTVTINGGNYSSMLINASKGAGMASAGTLTLNNTVVEKVRVGAVEVDGTITRANLINNNSTIGVIDYEK